MVDLRNCLKNLTQITTDGWMRYLAAVYNSTARTWISHAAGQNLS